MVQIDIACTVWPSYGKHCHRGSNPSSQHAKCRGNDAQKRSAFRLARAKHSKMICNHFSKQWQISWEACKLANPNPTAALTNPLNKKRLRIHKGLAKAESSLATQIRTEKFDMVDFLLRRRVPTVTSPACPCRWHRQTAKHIIMFCPLYDFGSWGSARAPANYTRLINTAHDLKNITSRLIKTALFAQFSVAAEQLYVKRRVPQGHGSS